MAGTTHDQTIPTSKDVYLHRKDESQNADDARDVQGHTTNVPFSINHDFVLSHSCPQSRLCFLSSRP